MEFYACSLRTWSDHLTLACLVSSAVSQFWMVLAPSASDVCFLGAGSSSGRHSFPMPPVDVKIRGVKVLVRYPKPSLRKGASSHSHDCGISVQALGPYTNQHKGDKPSHQRMLIVGSPRTRVHEYLISHLELN